MTNPTRGLWAVIEPDNSINFTTLAIRDQDSIDEWMKQEQTVTRMMRSTPVPSWEGYEAMGYRTEKVDIVPHEQQNKKEV